jgi:hypothetical protein
MDGNTNNCMHLTGSEQKYVFALFTLHLHQSSKHTYKKFGFKVLNKITNETLQFSSIESSVQ